MSVVLAPSRIAAALRLILVAGAMLLVGVAMVGAKGVPVVSRKAQWNEFELYAPQPVKGAAQLGGELILVIGLSWGCGAMLKIRL